MTTNDGFRKMRKSHIATENSTFRAKMVFKTEEAIWVDTPFPSILPISLHTRFHQGPVGFLKMDCLIATIKAHTKGKVSLYLAENAHLNTLGLHHKNPHKKCKKDAQDLIKRFDSVFSELDVVYSDFVLEDPNYHQYKTYISDLYNRDPVFRSHVDQEAHASFTPERRAFFSNEESYIEKSVLDILEKCATMLIFDSNGYRFQFYPGPTEKSSLYALQERQLTVISVKINSNNSGDIRKKFRRIPNTDAICINSFF